MQRKILFALRRIVGEQVSPILQWSDEYDAEDLDDALDHINLMRNRNFSEGLSDVEYTENKEDMLPQKLLPAIAFKGKTFGWMKNIPRKDWIAIFKEVHNRDISHILKASKNEGINLPIVIDNELGDGFARVLLAYALGEKLPVAMFEEFQG